ncbi:hypothetical protein GCM10010168_24240 [Actinoplanes ianthinogenes]|uniref:Uncharacterized protein n=1 Tax=Actinoplanes ianthinogenes TaxID=122358 RepID=A0ABM7M8U8_9ACTN|nr:hypothetical protein [Actinoplanes ianthinogenes]BCJ48064.1 hypothetical protein Aiant_87210 [Actinoplanes ianthinogenes]GGR06153.1 hypothetical protein GCM10010168_24240 [Actinoplanes ianthinogenes]
MTARVQRTPDQFAGDLSQLAAVDWATIWAGDGCTDDPARWAARAGWRLTHIDGDLNLTVTLASGGEVTLFRYHGGTRFDGASDVVWQRSATRAGENPAVVADVLAAWPSYLAAAETALGRPDHTVHDGAGAGLPDLPYWPADPAARAAQRTPVRAAVWSWPAQGAVVTVRVNLAARTAGTRGPGSASIRFVISELPDPQGSSRAITFTGARSGRPACAASRRAGPVRPG